jgi:hypothetical protein
MPSSKTILGALGVSLVVTVSGPPDKIMPLGANLIMSSSLHSQENISE